MAPSRPSANPCVAGVSVAADPATQEIDTVHVRNHGDYVIRQHYLVTIICVIMITHMIKHVITHMIAHTFRVHSSRVTRNRVTPSPRTGMHFFNSAR